MKSFWFLISIFFLITSCSNRNYTHNELSLIYDNEDILTPRQEKHLNAMVSNFQNETENGIIILTSDNLGKYGDAVEFASAFGIEHGILSVGNNNGLVIFLSKKLNQTSLATGLGSDKSIKDEISKHIIDSLMIPYFKEDEYYEGLKVAIEESIKNWN